jgi:hypothetical protein
VLKDGKASNKEGKKERRKEGKKFNHGSKVFS